jgi:hypothetical protein
VKRGSFSSLPIPHLFVSDLLPSEFYADLQASWPAFDEMAKPNPTIGRVDLIDPGFKCVQLAETSLSASQIENWKLFCSLMNGPFLTKPSAYSSRT